MRVCYKTQLPHRNQTREHTQEGTHRPMISFAFSVHVTATFAAIREGLQAQGSHRLSLHCGHNSPLKWSNNFTQPSHCDGVSSADVLTHADIVGNSAGA